MPNKTTSSSARRSRDSSRSRATTARVRRVRIVLGAAVGAVLLASVLIWLNQPSDTKTSEIDWATLPQSGATLGSDSAPVTIVEYADYQCPACGRFAREIMPHLIEDYVEPGKVRIEFRTVPFLGGQDVESDSNESVQAAEAAACAMDQGQFWAYSHALFLHQDGENQGAFANDNLMTLASNLGLDTTSFDACLSNGTHEAEVIENWRAAFDAGVTKTPTLVINGETVYLTTGGYEHLRDQIDAALAGDPIPA